MKETVFDVLLYLFERFMDGDADPSPDAGEVHEDLLEAGFPRQEIARALDWLDALSERQPVRFDSPPSFRIFSREEQARLDAEGQGLLLFLEQSGILNPASRELVLDRILAIDGDPLSLDNLKWMVLMVLFTQPDEELAYTRMEHLVHGNLPALLH